MSIKVSILQRIYGSDFLQHRLAHVLILAFTLLTVLVANVTNAQEAVVAQQKSADTRTETLRAATINIQDAKVTRSGEDFSIQFTLSNQLGTQPGVKYGVILVEDTPNGQFIVDRYIHKEAITIGPGERVTRTVMYHPGPQKGGTYALLLVSESQYGFPFGMSYLGDFELPDTTTGLYADPSTCYVSVLSGTTTSQHTAEQGIDAGEGEQVVGHCTVENRGKTKIVGLANVSTYARSLFGSIVETEKVERTPFELESGEKKEIATILPKAKEPQAYSAAVSYGEGSNTVVFRYVVRGGSGTLQNIIFDKGAYLKGETAQVSIFWTSSADGFLGSRAGNGSELTRPSLLMLLKSERGAACAESHTLELEDSGFVKAYIPVTSDCPRPQVNLKLQDATAGVLSETTYPLPSARLRLEGEGIFAEVEPALSWQDDPLLIGIGISIFLACIALTLLLARARRDRHALKTTTDTKPESESKLEIPPVLFYLLVMGAAMFVAPTQAHAETFWALYDDYTHTYREILYTVNTDKFVYVQGEDVTITGTGEIQGECGNPLCVGDVDCVASGLLVTEVDSAPLATPIEIIEYKEGRAATGGYVGQVLFGNNVVNTTAMAPGIHILTIQGYAAIPGFDTVPPVEIAFVVVAPPSPPSVPVIPTLGSPTHSYVSNTDAHMGATIISDGGKPILERGTCWGLSTNPSTNCLSEGGTQVSPFMHPRTGLPSGTTIYYRGYARNEVGTGYSSTNSFDTVTASPVSLQVCLLGAIDCVSGGGTKTINLGDEIEITWDGGPSAVSCSKVRGPADFDVLSTSDTDNDVTEPPANGSETVTVSCTDGVNTTQSTVNVVTSPYPDCPLDIKENCSLPSRSDGQTAGSCEAGYLGSCNYTCNAGVWSKNNNTCVHTEITRFEICDLGMNDASCMVNKNVDPDTEVTIRWDSVGANSCSGIGFNTSGNTNGSVDATAGAVAGDIDTFTLVCENGGNLTPPEQTVLTTFASVPDLTVSSDRVKLNETIDIEWDTNNGNERLCSLTGGGIDSAATLGNGTRTTETGITTGVVITGRTTFTLKCGPLTDVAIVEVIPSAWEQ